MGEAILTKVSSKRNICLQLSAPHIQPITETTRTLGIHAIKKHSSSKDQSLLVPTPTRVHFPVYIWSPTINLDSIWSPVKKFINQEVKVDAEAGLDKEFHSHSEVLIKVTKI